MKCPLVARPDRVRLPAMVAIASEDPPSPFKADALVILRENVDRDYGRDWVAWMGAIAENFGGSIDGAEPPN